MVRSIVSDQTVSCNHLSKPHHEKTGFLHLLKTKPQISCAVTAQLDDLAARLENFFHRQLRLKLILLIYVKMPTMDKVLALVTKT